MEQKEKEKGREERKKKEKEKEKGKEGRKKEEKEGKEKRRKKKKEEKKEKGRERRKKKGKNNLVADRPQKGRSNPRFFFILHNDQVDPFRGNPLSGQRNPFKGGGVIRHPFGGLGLETGKKGCHPLLKDMSFFSP